MLRLVERNMRWIVGASLLLAGCVAEPPAIGGRNPAVGEEITGIVVPDTGATITARLCRPTSAAGPAPLVVINHGSPANAAERPGMRAASCTTEAVRWFTDRGFVALLPLRRGYGVSGGAWAEGYGRCLMADFAPAGLATAADIAAAIAHARRLAGIRTTGVLVVGQSAGGWGSLALASNNPTEVVAIINMAGGRGGWAEGAPNTNCAPEQLVRVAGLYGATARVPTQWIYTANDTFFAPALARRMHEAFTRAGGRAQFLPLGPFGRDGHSLFFSQGGSAVWGPPVEFFLRAQGVLAPRS